MSKKKQKKQHNIYIQFTTIALQIGVTIYIGNLLGEWLDTQYINESQLYTKICTLVAVFVAIFSVILQVSKISKQND